MEIKCNFCRLGFLYPIDNLEYQYSHNKLLKVIDHTNSLDGFRDGQHPNGVTEADYFYDANGNMTQDWNKGIDAITYNHLNLPTRINFKVDQGEKFISYIYNALGQKVSKQVILQSSSEQINTLTEYLSGYQYVGGILQLFPTAEGYVSVTNGKDFDYVYNYTDHLGNIRVSYTMPKGSTTLSILEENHYYPFGMKHANYGDGRHDYVRNPDGTGYAIIDEVHRNKYQYKYNGKEFQDELSLNWYDYQARNYDPAIGRWMNIDPLAETSRRWSPYSYCYNNPLRFIDPDGMQADDVIIRGRERQKAFTELQSSVSSELTLSMDDKGKVTYTQNSEGPLTEDASQLVSAINDASITVQVLAENTHVTSTNEFYAGGAFMGNTVTTDPIINTNSVVANQSINPIVLGKLSTDYKKPGADTLHEVTEAYQGAIISQTSGVSSPRAGQTGSVYPQAHISATPQSGDVIRTLYDASGNVVPGTTTGNGFPENAIRLDVKTTNGTTILTVQ